MRRKQPVFLARTGYRLRRLMDVARLLPVAGVAIFMLPLLWGGGATHDAIIYLFAGWLFLIVVAALLAGPLSRSSPGAPDEPKKEPGRGTV